MEASSQTSLSKHFNAFGYTLFLLAGIYFSFCAEDSSSGPLFIWLGFIFDPFDQQKPFYKRKAWHQVVFYAHLVLAIVSVLFLLFR